MGKPRTCIIKNLILSLSLSLSLSLPEFDEFSNSDQRNSLLLSTGRHRALNLGHLWRWSRIREKNQQGRKSDISEKEGRRVDGATPENYEDIERYACLWGAVGHVCTTCIRSVQDAFTASIEFAHRSVFAFIHTVTYLESQAGSSDPREIRRSRSGRHTRLCVQKERKWI